MIIISSLILPLSKTGNNEILCFTFTSMKSCFHFCVCKIITCSVGFYSIFGSKLKRFPYWYFVQLFSQIKPNHSLHPTDTNTLDVKVISVGVINKITPGPNMSAEKQFPSAQASTPFKQSEKVKVASSADLFGKLRRITF